MKVTVGDWGSTLEYQRTGTVLVVDVCFYYCALARSFVTGRGSLWLSTALPELRPAGGANIVAPSAAQRHRAVRQVVCP